LQNVRLFEGLTSDEAKTSEGFFVFMLENDDVKRKRKPRSLSSSFLKKKTVNEYVTRGGIWAIYLVAAG